MREIVLDTETTGRDADLGDRIVEIGCVELLNHIPTGRSYHVYLNPQRRMSEGAFQVHGLSDEFLADKPLFEAVCEEFLAFIDGARLVIHNAPFDMGFLNMEFERIGRPRWPDAQVLDTLMMARRKFPGAPASLDALCSRFSIDNTKRTKHGALLDAELLAEVYIELIGGKQVDLGLAAPSLSRGPLVAAGARAERRPAPSRLSDAERAAHAAFIAGFKGEMVWRDYLPTAEAAE
ncbi:DNA polymerase III subunit epsilon [Salinarimonas ramus]|uniref:DNA polymerase III subunit epsilon n=1 Tax=Salinarimonas ramus TaxID=690164 RepID=A0A917Q828_9HYPH|nr:DNA polymerase III subunit epsilon [Salinarimonas ramus]GGK34513.1 DNA polymerase III subunit epsilon [Salinarimonas ramus]